MRREDCELSLHFANFLGPRIQPKRPLIQLFFKLPEDGAIIVFCFLWVFLLFFFLKDTTKDSEFSTLFENKNNLLLKKV